MEIANLVFGGFGMGAFLHGLRLEIQFGYLSISKDVKSTSQPETVPGFSADFGTIEAAHFLLLSMMFKRWILSVFFSMRM